VTDQPSKPLTGRAFSKLKRPVVFISIGALLIVLFTPLSFYKQRSSYECSECMSSRDVYQWSFGFGGLWGFPVTPEWETLSASQIYKDYAPANHQHTWVFAQGSPYRLGFIWYGCGIGPGGNGGEFGEFYESNAAFRNYLAGLERQKQLTRAQIFAMLALPRYPSKNQTNKSDFEETAQTSKKLLGDFLNALNRTN
jgi:hypothetical protein